MACMDRIIGRLDDTLEAVQNEGFCVASLRFPMESPYMMYDKLLNNIANELGENQKEAFTYFLSTEIPANILEKPQPLRWFKKLEQKKKLSIDDLSLLETFLQNQEMLQLLDSVKVFQKKVEIMKFLSNNVKCDTEKRLDLFDRKFRVFKGKSWGSIRKSCDRMLEDLTSDVKINTQIIDSALRTAHKDLLSHAKSHDHDDVAFNCMVMTERIYERYGEWLTKHEKQVIPDTNDESPSDTVPWMTREQKEMFLKLFLAVCIGIQKFIDTCQRGLAVVLVLVFLLFLISIGIVIK